jgi:hypothetical protein
MMWLIATKAGRTLIIVALALAMFGGWTLWQRNDAATDAVSEIVEINNDLSNKAITARDARRLCVGAGGVWDFAAGRCTEDSE